MDKRRIVLLDAAGSIANIGVLDVTRVDNANTQCMMQLEVQTRCDLGHWHAGQRIQLVPWGRALEDPYGKTA
jgi:hypothetical protein